MGGRLAPEADPEPGMAGNAVGDSHGLLARPSEVVESFSLPKELCVMKKALRIVSAAFALALLPVAFHADGADSSWKVGVGLNEACARTRGGVECGEGFFWCTCGPSIAPMAGHQCKRIDVELVW